MPVYEYKCHGCGKEFELRQKFSDEPLKTHPECGGIVERLISVPAFQFKGTGWYITDYAKKNGSNGGAKSEKNGGSGKDKSETAAKPAESKPPASSEIKPAH